MDQIPENEQKIIENANFFKERFFTYDEPLPFAGFMLYPVPLKNYNEFMSACACLTLNKNDEFAGVKKTHLGYLVMKINDEKEGPLWASRFSKIIELCLHVKPGFKCDQCGDYVTYQDFLSSAQSAQENGESVLTCRACKKGTYVASLNVQKDEKTGREYFVIDGKNLSPDDFNAMRKYIMYQNLPDFKDDSFVHKAIREDQKKRAELEAKKSGSATLEKKMVCLSAATSYTMEEIYGLTIRKFIQLMSAANDLIEYKIMKTAVSSGMVKLKDGQTIEHWIYKKERPMLEGVVDVDSFTSRLSQ